MHLLHALSIGFVSPIRTRRRCHGLSPKAWLVALNSAAIAGPMAMGNCSIRIDKNVLPRTASAWVCPGRRPQIHWIPQTWVGRCRYPAGLPGSCPLPSWAPHYNPGSFSMNSIEKSLKNLEFFYISFPFPRFSPDKPNFSTRFNEAMRVCLTIVFFLFHSGVVEAGG